MLRDLIILGDGIHGQEMAEIVERVNAVHPTWNLLGYLSSKTPPLPVGRNGYRVLGAWDSLQEFPDAMLLPDNEWRQDGLPEERLATLIDPSAFVSRTARIGPGCVLYPNCFVGANAVLGKRVFCLSGCVINHDDVLEDNVVLASGVTLAGSVYVEEGAYLGQACTVRQHLRIGRKSLIGMGSVIIRDVPAGAVMVGNPGRQLSKREG